MARRIEYIHQDSPNYRVTVTHERVTIKGNLDTPYNLHWLANVVDKVIPLEMPSMRGRIRAGQHLHFTLYTDNKSITQVFNLEKFYGEKRI